MRDTARQGQPNEPTKILEDVLCDLGKVKDALYCLYTNLPEILDHSIEGPVYILKLITNDIESIHDDIVRQKEGRCPIRHAAPSALRPPESWESMHQR